jgi:hypothetical protein
MIYPNVITSNTDVLEHVSGSSSSSFSSGAARSSDLSKAQSLIKKRIHVPKAQKNCPTELFHAFLYMHTRITMTSETICHTQSIYNTTMQLRTFLALPATSPASQYCNPGSCEATTNERVGNDDQCFCSQYITCRCVMTHIVKQ